MLGRCSRGRSGVLDVQVLARGCDPWVAEGCSHARERGGGRSVLTCVCLSATPGTAAHQAPLSTGFFNQEYWTGLLFPPPGDLPHPRIEPRSLSLQADSVPTELSGKPEMMGAVVKGGSPEDWRAPHFRGSSRNSIRTRPFPGW